MMGLTLYAGVVLISLMGSAIVGPMWTNGSGHPPLLERCHFVLDICNRLVIKRGWEIPELKWRFIGYLVSVNVLMGFF